MAGAVEQESCIIGQVRYNDITYPEYTRDRTYFKLGLCQMPML